MAKIHAHLATIEHTKYGRTETAKEHIRSASQIYHQLNEIHQNLQHCEKTSYVCSLSSLTAHWKHQTDILEASSFAAD